jgi:hypothetical protein
MKDAKGLALFLNGEDGGGDDGGGDSASGWLKMSGILNWQRGAGQRCT